MLPDMTQEPCLPLFWDRDFPSPRMTAGNAIQFEGASVLPFAHSPVCSKQFRHVKAKSWT